MISLFGFSCRENRADSDTIRQAFSGIRPTQARLTGFSFGSCSSSRDLIPITECQSTDTIVGSNGFRIAKQKIIKAVRANATSDDLQAAALIDLTSGSRDESALLAAHAYLSEAANRETDQKKQATIRSDLAATHLQMAELLQSPLEIAAALEQSLWALELDPDLPEARFNQHLSRVLLGMGDRSGPTTDPWESELNSRLLAGPSENQQPGGCPSGKEIFEAVDSWSSHPSGPFPISGSCLTKSEDRFLHDFHQQANLSPARAAMGWQAFRAATSALERADLETVIHHLARLRAMNPPPALELEAESMEAIIAYHQNAYEKSLQIIDRLNDRAETKNYHSISAKSLRLAGLICQIRGEHGEAIEYLKLALEAAKRSGSPQIEAAVLSILVEQQEVFGREEDAWVSIAMALRRLDQDRQKNPRINCLHSAARLAQQRGFSRVARLAHEIAVALGEKRGGTSQIETLKERGELFADLGQIDLARLDWSRATKLLGTGALGREVAATLAADLKYLESRVAETPTARRSAAQAALNEFQNTDYSRRLISARLALALSQKELGETDSAISTLKGAFADLSTVTTSVSWAEATAIVEAARPVADLLIGLLLDQGDFVGVWETIGRYQALRTGQPPQPLERTEDQRLVYFVRDQETIVIYEGSLELHVARSRVARSEIESLRETLLDQLRANSSQARLARTTKLLADHLIFPISDRLISSRPLAIIPDDVISGIPFAVLPSSRDKQDLLIDRFSTIYSTDLRRQAAFVPGSNVLIVGSDAKNTEFGQLDYVESEARAVAQTYNPRTLLLGMDASPARVRQELLQHYDIGHVAAHFIIKPRSPLSSYFVLEPIGSDPGHLPLTSLLTSQVGLLYLSGCDTGRSLPPSASGLRSLAQAFSIAKVPRSVLSLWPLGDETGARIAAEFHRQVAAGADLAESLRSAQLRERDKPPGHWAPLALYY